MGGGAALSLHGPHARPQAGAPATPAAHAASLVAADHSPRLAALVAAWFLTSVSSLFLAKHCLAAHPVNEGTFTLALFASSLLFGLLSTRVLGLHALAPLTRRQLRAILPLAAAFLVKELLKYASIARLSVNLINTIRSLGPVITIALERVLWSHRPPRSVVVAMAPIALGVALTSMDEMHAASTGRTSILVFCAGAAAAVASTVINQSQNMYSKVLFGQARIDPVSLQIYLSGLSLALLAPCFAASSLYSTFLSGASSPPAALPAPRVVLLLLAVGFVNFLSSQLAFTTLSKVTPVSYSVANTFKRVLIALVAILFLGERLSPINGSGIVISIAGVYYYERASREYKAAKLYRQVPSHNARADRKAAAADAPDDLAFDTLELLHAHAAPAPQDAVYAKQALLASPSAPPQAVQLSMR
jgi:solute carrier family 35, member E1